GYYTENRTMDQRSHTKSNVSPGSFYELAHSNLPYFFVNLLDTPKLNQSITSSFLRCESLPDFRLRQHVEVRLDLFGELLVHQVPVEQVAAKAGQARNQRHGLLSPQ